MQKPRCKLVGSIFLSTYTFITLFEDNIEITLENQRLDATPLYHNLKPGIHLAYKYQEAIFKLFLYLKERERERDHSNMNYGCFKWQFNCCEALLTQTSKILMKMMSFIICIRYSVFVLMMDCSEFTLKDITFQQFMKYFCCQNTLPAFSH